MLISKEVRKNETKDSVPFNRCCSELECICALRFQYSDKGRCLPAARDPVLPGVSSVLQVSQVHLSQRLGKFHRAFFYCLPAP